MAKSDVKRRRRRGRQRERSGGMEQGWESGCHHRIARRQKIGYGI
jgi:hypothetical protein